jgi:hypothetical protein
MTPAESVVAEYDTLLEEAAVADATLEALSGGQRRRGLSFGARPLSVALRPHFIDEVQFRQLAATSELVYTALQRLESAVLDDPALRAELALEPEEERLAVADPGFRSASPSARLDGFLTDRIRFVEYNAESPAGMAYSDNLAAVFDELPVMRELRRRHRLRPLPVRAAQQAAMLAAFEEWARGRPEAPTIAIVDWEGLPTASEFELFRQHFEAAGIPTVVCDPRALELRDGRLQFGDRRINLVYRRVLTSELLARDEETRTLREAYLCGATCVVNSFRAKLLHKKMSLALLSDDRWAHIYTAEQRAAIESHVPWTRRLAEGATTRHGEPVPDLVEHAVQHRDELVLKPNDEYGGKGVVLGWTVGAGDWERELRQALQQPTVLQERVPVPRERFPVAADGMAWMDLSIDIDPYLFHGRVSGCLTRLASSELLNVTTGHGSVVPAYLVENAG